MTNINKLFDNKNVITQKNMSTYLDKIIKMKNNEILEYLFRIHYFYISNSDKFPFENKFGYLLLYFRVINHMFGYAIASLSNRIISKTIKCYYDLFEIVKENNHNPSFSDFQLHLMLYFIGLDIYKMTDMKNINHMFIENICEYSLIDKRIIKKIKFIYDFKNSNGEEQKYYREISEIMCYLKKSKSYYKYYIYQLIDIYNNINVKHYGLEANKLKELIKCEYKDIYEFTLENIYNTLNFFNSSFFSKNRRESRYLISFKAYANINDLFRELSNEKWDLIMDDESHCQQFIKKNEIGILYVIPSELVYFYNNTNTKYYKSILKFPNYYLLFDISLIPTPSLISLRKEDLYIPIPEITIDKYIFLNSINTGYKSINTGYKGINTGYKSINTGYKSINTGYKSIFLKLESFFNNPIEDQSDIDILVSNSGEKNRIQQLYYFFLYLKKNSVDIYLLANIPYYLIVNLFRTLYQIELENFFKLNYLNDKSDLIFTNSDISQPAIYIDIMPLSNDNNPYNIIKSIYTIPITYELMTYLKYSVRSNINIRNLVLELKIYSSEFGFDKKFIFIIIEYLLLDRLEFSIDNLKKKVIYIVKILEIKDKWTRLKSDMEYLINSDLCSRIEFQSLLIETRYISLNIKTLKESLKLNRKNITEKDAYIFDNLDAIIIDLANEIINFLNLRFSIKSYILNNYLINKKNKSMVSNLKNKISLVISKNSFEISTPLFEEWVVDITNKDLFLNEIKNYIVYLLSNSAHLENKLQRLIKDIDKIIFKLGFQGPPLTPSIVGLIIIFSLDKITKLEIENCLFKDVCCLENDAPSQEIVLRKNKPRFILEKYYLNGNYKWDKRIVYNRIITILPGTPIIYNEQDKFGLIIKYNNKHDTYVILEIDSEAIQEIDKNSINYILGEFTLDNYIEENDPMIEFLIKNISRYDFIEKTEAIIILDNIKEIRKIAKNYYRSIPNSSFWENKTYQELIQVYRSNRFNLDSHINANIGLIKMKNHEFKINNKDIIHLIEQIYDNLEERKMDFNIEWDNFITSRDRKNNYFGFNSYWLFLSYELGEKYFLNESDINKKITEVYYQKEKYENDFNELKKGIPNLLLFKNNIKLINKDKIYLDRLFFENGNMNLKSIFDILLINPEYKNIEQFILDNFLLGYKFLDDIILIERVESIIYHYRMNIFNICQEYDLLDIYDKLFHLHNERMTELEIIRKLLFLQKMINLLQDGHLILENILIENFLINKVINTNVEYCNEMTILYAQIEKNIIQSKNLFNIYCTIETQMKISVIKKFIENIPKSNLSYLEKTHKIDDILKIYIINNNTYGIDELFSLNYLIHYKNIDNNSQLLNFFKPKMLGGGEYGFENENEIEFDYNRLDYDKVEQPGQTPLVFEERVDQKPEQQTPFNYPSDNSNSNSNVDIELNTESNNLRDIKDFIIKKDGKDDSVNKLHDIKKSVNNLTGISTYLSKENEFTKHINAETINQAITVENINVFINNQVNILNTLNLSEPIKTAKEIKVIFECILIKENECPEDINNFCKLWVKLLLIYLNYYNKNYSKELYIKILNADDITKEFVDNNLIPIKKLADANTQKIKENIIEFFTNLTENDSKIYLNENDYLDFLELIDKFSEYSKIDINTELSNILINTKIGEYLKKKEDDVFKRYQEAFESSNKIPEDTNLFSNNLVYDLTDRYKWSDGKLFTATHEEYKVNHSSTDITSIFEVSFFNKMESDWEIFSKKNKFTDEENEIKLNYQLFYFKSMIGPSGDRSHRDGGVTGRTTRELFKNCMSRNSDIRQFVTNQKTPDKEFLNSCLRNKSKFNYENRNNEFTSAAESFINSFIQLKDENEKINNYITQLDAKIIKLDNLTAKSEDNYIKQRRKNFEYQKLSKEIIFDKKKIELKREHILREIRKIIDSEPFAIVIINDNYSVRTSKEFISQKKKLLQRIDSLIGGIGVFDKTKEQITIENHEKEKTYIKSIISDTHLLNTLCKTDTINDFEFTLFNEGKEIPFLNINNIEFGDNTNYAKDIIFHLIKSIRCEEGSHLDKGILDNNIYLIPAILDLNFTNDDDIYKNFEKYSNDLIRYEGDVKFNLYTDPDNKEKAKEDLQRQKDVIIKQLNVIKGVSTDVKKIDDQLLFSVYLDKVEYDMSGLAYKDKLKEELLPMTTKLDNQIESILETNTDKRILNLLKLGKNALLVSQGKSSNIASLELGFLGDFFNNDPFLEASNWLSNQLTAQTWYQDMANARKGEEGEITKGKDHIMKKLKGLGIPVDTFENAILITKSLFFLYNLSQGGLDENYINHIGKNALRIIISNIVNQFFTAEQKEDHQIDSLAELMKNENTQDLIFLTKSYEEQLRDIIDMEKQNDPVKLAKLKKLNDISRQLSTEDILAIKASINIFSETIGVQRDQLQEAISEIIVDSTMAGVEHVVAKTGELLRKKKMEQILAKRNNFKNGFYTQTEIHLGEGESPYVLLNDEGELMTLRKAGENEIFDENGTVKSIPLKEQVELMKQTYDEAIKRIDESKDSDQIKNQEKQKLENKYFQEDKKKGKKYFKFNINNNNLNDLVNAGLVVNKNQLRQQAQRHRATNFAYLFLDHKSDLDEDGNLTEVGKVMLENSNFSEDEKQTAIDNAQQRQVNEKKTIDGLKAKREKVKPEEQKKIDKRIKEIEGNVDIDFNYKFMDAEEDVNKLEIKKNDLQKEIEALDKIAQTEEIEKKKKEILVVDQKLLDKKEMASFVTKMIQDGENEFNNPNFKKHFTEALRDKKAKNQVFKINKLRDHPIAPIIGVSVTTELGDDLVGRRVTGADVEKVRKAGEKTPELKDFLNLKEIGKLFLLSQGDKFMRGSITLFTRKFLRYTPSGILEVIEDTYQELHSALNEKILSDDPDEANIQKYALIGEKLSNAEERIGEDNLGSLNSFYFNTKTGIWGDNGVAYKLRNGETLKFGNKGMKKAINPNVNDNNEVFEKKILYLEGIEFINSINTDLIKFYHEKQQTTELTEYIVGLEESLSILLKKFNDKNGVIYKILDDLYDNLGRYSPHLPLRLCFDQLKEIQGYPSQVKFTIELEKAKIAFYEGPTSEELYTAMAKLWIYQQIGEKIGLGINLISKISMTFKEIKKAKEEQKKLKSELENKYGNGLYLQTKIDLASEKLRAKYLKMQSELAYNNHWLDRIYGATHYMGRKIGFMKTTFNFFMTSIEDLYDNVYYYTFTSSLVETGITTFLSYAVVKSIGSAIGFGKIITGIGTSIGAAIGAAIGAPMLITGAVIAGLFGLFYWFTRSSRTVIHNLSTDLFGLLKVSLGKKSRKYKDLLELELNLTLHRISVLEKQRIECSKKLIPPITIDNDCFGLLRTSQLAGLETTISNLSTNSAKIISYLKTFCNSNSEFTVSIGDSHKINCDDITSVENTAVINYSDGMEFFLQRINYIGAKYNWIFIQDKLLTIDKNGLPNLFSQDFLEWNDPTGRYGNIVFNNQTFYMVEDIFNFKDCKNKDRKFTSCNETSKGGARGGKKKKNEEGFTMKNLSLPNLRCPEIIGISDNYLTNNLIEILTREDTTASTTISTDLLKNFFNKYKDQLKKIQDKNKLDTETNHKYGNNFFGLLDNICNKEESVSYNKYDVIRQAIFELHKNNIEGSLLSNQINIYEESLPDELACLLQYEYNKNILDINKCLNELNKCESDIDVGNKERCKIIRLEKLLDQINKLFINVNSLLTNIHDELDELSAILDKNKILKKLGTTLDTITERFNNNKMMKGSMNNFINGLKIDIDQSIQNKRSYILSQKLNHNVDSKPKYYRNQEKEICGNKKCDTYCENGKRACLYLCCNITFPNGQNIDININGWMEKAKEISDTLLEKEIEIFRDNINKESDFMNMLDEFDPNAIRFSYVFSNEWLLRIKDLKNKYDKALGGSYDNLKIKVTYKDINPKTLLIYYENLLLKLPQKYPITLLENLYDSVDSIYMFNNYKNSIQFGLVPDDKISINKSIYKYHQTYFYTIYHELDLFSYNLLNI